MVWRTVKADKTGKRARDLSRAVRSWHFVVKKYINPPVFGLAENVPKSGFSVAKYTLSQNANAVKTNSPFLYQTNSGMAIMTKIGKMS
jgi:hypothetical protein